jgi:16S rRNA G966 N2-methylase RsmD
MGLSWLGGGGREPFDLIFSGAPYKDEKGRPLAFVQFLLEEISKDALLAPEGWFIAQHSIRETFQTLPGWNFFRKEKYGDTALSFFRHAQ